MSISVLSLSQWMAAYNTSYPRRSDVGGGSAKCIVSEPRSLNCQI